jgi:hypothetical protein
MGWKENRRRKRTWYRHYKQIADEVVGLVRRGGEPQVAAEAIVCLFYELYERRRLHGKRRVAVSAFESMLLACRDAGLGDMTLQARTYAAGTRPTSRGALDIRARTKTPTSEPVQPNSRGQYLSDIASVARMAEGPTAELTMNTLRNAINVLSVNNPPASELIVAARAYNAYAKDVYAEPMRDDSTKEMAREAEARPDTEIPF